MIPGQKFLCFVLLMCTHCALGDDVDQSTINQWTKEFNDDNFYPLNLLIYKDPKKYIPIFKTAIPAIIKKLYKNNEAKLSNLLAKIHHLNTYELKSTAYHSVYEEIESFDDPNGNLTLLLMATLKTFSDEIDTLPPTDDTKVAKDTILDLKYLIPPGIWSLFYGDIVSFIPKAKTDGFLNCHNSILNVGDSPEGKEGFAQQWFVDRSKNGKAVRFRNRNNGKVLDADDREKMFVVSSATYDGSQQWAVIEKNQVDSWVYLKHLKTQRYLRYNPHNDEVVAVIPNTRVNDDELLWAIKDIPFISID